jgi:hypothetical protein
MMFVIGVVLVGHESMCVLTTLCPTAFPVQTLPFRLFGSLPLVSLSDVFPRFQRFRGSGIDPFGQIDELFAGGLK